MFRWSSVPRHSVAVLALGGAALPAASAQAAPVTRTASYYCTWGEAHGAGGSFDVTAPYAATEQRGTAPLSVVAKDNYSRLNQLGITAVEGTATLRLRVTADGVTSSKAVTVPVPRTATVAGAPTAFDLGAAIPKPDAAGGPVIVRLESATLDLRAYDEDGFPMRAPDRATTDVITGAPVTQPANPTAFRVPCSSQDGPEPWIVATYLAGDAPFVRLTASRAVSFHRGYASIALDWAKPAGTFPIAGYSIEVRKADGPFSGESMYDSAPADATGAVFDGASALRLIVTAFDVDGASVQVMDTGNVTPRRTQAAPITRALAVTATVNVPTITKKPFTLTGEANLTVADASFGVAGGIEFEPMLTRLTVKSSQLPISSRVTLVRGGDATGTFTNGVLRVAQNVRLKVLDARAFGAIPIDLGNACQTKSYSALKLVSGPPAPLTSQTDQILGYGGSFSTYSGKVTSPLAVSDLNGCAAIADGFDPQAAGAGSISMSLAPAPVVTSAATSAG